MVVSKNSMSVCPGFPGALFGKVQRLPGTAGAFFGRAVF